jgi:hypothetical protein
VAPLHAIVVANAATLDVARHRERCAHPHRRAVVQDIRLEADAHGGVRLVARLTECGELFPEVGTLSRRPSNSRQRRLAGFAQRPANVRTSEREHALLQNDAPGATEKNATTSRTGGRFLTMAELLATTALGESAFGLLLVVYPSVVIKLLIGVETTGAEVIASRIAGISLIALSVACWPARNGRQAAYGMLTYSTLALLYLIVLGISGTSGILLWPAVAVHGLLTALLCWQQVRMTRAGS